MNKFLLAAASALGMTTTAFAADLTYSPPASGSDFYAPGSAVQAHVDLYGGGIFINVDSGSDIPDSAGMIGGAGRANLPLHDGWNLQADVQSLAVLINDDGDYSAPTEFSGYAHLYKMAPGSHALGIYGGASWLQGPQVYTAGLEGQMYWQRFTLYGQASAAAINYGDTSGSAVQLRGEGQWFLNDNTGLLGDVIWTAIDIDDESVNVFTLAGTVMHRFSGTPIAGFAKVRWDHGSGGGSSGDATTVLAGVRIFADPPGSTLRSSLIGVPMNVEPIQFGLAGIGGAF